MPIVTHNLFWGFGEGEHRLDVVEGTWPTDVEGAVFIVGPDKRRPGGHWFNEHGLLCKIDCVPDAEGRIRVRHRLVDTPVKRIRDRFPSLFKKVWVVEMSPFGTTNLANTNVQVIDGRLFVGYDVGRQVEVDPETLEFLTPVGANDEWTNVAPGLLEPMVSVAAHPGPDDREHALWFVNYVMMPIPGIPTGCWLARWDLEGAVKRWKLAGMTPFDSIHDVKVTQDYVVITDLPFVVEPQTFMGGKRRRAAQDFTRMWIVRKADLERARPEDDVPVKELTIPYASGHIAIDYRNPNGELTVHLQHIGAADLTVTFERGETDARHGRMIDPNFEGMISLGLQPPITGRYRIKAETGEVLETKHCWDKEFWGGILWSQNITRDDSIDHAQNLWYGALGWDPDMIPSTMWRLYKDYPSAVVPMDALPSHYIPGKLGRIDLETMKYAEWWEYPTGTFPHPPTFVPRKNAKHDTDGYVVVVVHQSAPKEVQIFDAANLSRGPLARATAPTFNPPLLLHSCYYAPRRGPRNSRYAVDPYRDAWGALRGFSPSRMGSLVKAAKGMAAMARRPEKALSIARTEA